MTFELKEGQGTAFKSKSEHPKAPKWSGEIMVEGKKKRISIWEKEGQKGVYLSLKLEEFKEKPQGECPF